MDNDVIINTEQLRTDIKIKRVIQLEISMDVCCKQIGISKPTLARIEKGNMPELITFFKLIKWLDKDISNYVNY
jgi:DNA-binding XRE family transcriptional regulator